MPGKKMKDPNMMKSSYEMNHPMNANHPNMMKPAYKAKHPNMMKPPYTMRPSILNQMSHNK